MNFKTIPIPLKIGLNHINLPSDFEILDVINYRSVPHIVINYSEEDTIIKDIEVCYENVKVNTLPAIEGRSTVGYTFIGSSIIYNNLCPDQLIHIWLKN